MVGRFTAQIGAARAGGDWDLSSQAAWGGPPGPRATPWSPPRHWTNDIRRLAGPFRHAPIGEGGEREAVYFSRGAGRRLERTQTVVAKSGPGFYFGVISGRSQWRYPSRASRR